MPRAPKAFGPDLRDGFVDDTIADLLGIETHHRQANILTLAPVKSEAIQTLQAARLIGPHSGAYVKTQVGNEAQKLIDSGLLSYDPERPFALVYHEATKDQPIVKVTLAHGPTVPNDEPVVRSVVGHWRLVDHMIIVEPSTAAERGA